MFNLYNKTFYLVQQNNIFKRRPKFMFDAKTKTLNVDNKCQKFRSFDVSQEFVTHADVDMSTLHKSRQVRNWYLQLSQYTHWNVACEWCITLAWPYSFSTLHHLKQNLFIIIITNTLLLSLLLTLSRNSREKKKILQSYNSNGHWFRRCSSEKLPYNIIAV